MLTRLVEGHGTPSPARVVVGVSGSPGSLTVLGRATDEARRRGAELRPVPAWEPPGGDLAARRSPAVAGLAAGGGGLAGGGAPQGVGGRPGGRRRPGPG